ncbi:hypothetical protein B0H14DRAFT_2816498 [Mycena olivaceomarginata]|nr:hypothetical protein B0H14DRAFT_2816498 [Mycena olivaceomarginata]
MLPCVLLATLWLVSRIRSKCLHCTKVLRPSHQEQIQLTINALDLRNLKTYLLRETKGRSRRIYFGRELRSKARWWMSHIWHV